MDQESTHAASAAVTTALDPTARQFIEVAGTAFAASFLRYQRWQNDKGQILWFRIFFEIPGSIAFGVMAFAVCSYLGGVWATFWIVAGMAGFFGMIGAPLLSTLAIKFLGVKEDGSGKP